MISIRAFLAFLRSFLKRDWTFDDYPLEIAEQPGPHRFRARLIKWPQLVGFGSSAAEAVADLRLSFEAFRSERPLPRPGTKVPIQFAPTMLLQAIEDTSAELLQDFFESIIGIDRSECFISDESSVSDFDGAFEKTTEARLQLIRERYGIHLSESDDLRLVSVLAKVTSGKNR